MTRKSRQISITGIYHVILRGINRQQLFHDSDDYGKFIQILHQQVTPKDESGQSLPPKCAIYAYCLMPNHVHLLVKAGKDALGNIVKSIGIAYVAYYHKKYVRAGHLFQDRFKSEPVNDVNHLITLIRFIYQNPIAEGLTKHVEKYPWSSWQEYQSPEKCQMPVCSTRAVFQQISFDDLKALVDEPLENSAVMLEYDKKERKQLAEEKLEEFMKNIFGISHPQSIKHLSAYELEAILQIAYDRGFSIRCLAHYTKLTTYAVYKYVKNRP